MEIAELSIAGLHAAYAAGATPEQAMSEVLRRIEALGDPGIFISLRAPGDILADAAALGPFDAEARPLYGVPFAIKDNIDLEGLPTTAACPDYTYEPVSSARAVELLVEAGAIPIGKTNLDQFATGLVGTRTPYPVPLNALDPALIPGGSSSGSAVAVAQGLVAFALGTDTAGSGRVPAALNGIVGLKPSLGAVSTRGVVPACRTLDCVSVFAGSVDEAWRVFRALAVYDEADPFARPWHAAGPETAARVGVPAPAQRQHFDDGLAKHAYEVHLAELSEQVELVEIDLDPFLAVARLLYEGPWLAERYAAIKDFIESQPGALHPVTREIIAAGAGPMAVDAFEAAYELAALRRKCEAVWRWVDALCLPTIPCLYTLEDVAADPIGTNSRLGTYTNFVNLLGLSALAVPGATRTDGGPAGVTFIAPDGGDAMLARLGAGFRGEAASMEAEPGDDVALVVVGAHMRGLALVHELEALGARFLRAAQTLPEYRLFELPGGPPRRPGLLRTVNGDGRAIAVEVWSLPRAAFARLTEAVPAPLSIGTVRLGDGGTVKGYLAEPAGLVGAREITAFGGWRAFLASEADAPGGV